MALAETNVVDGIIDGRVVSQVDADNFLGWGQSLHNHESWAAFHVAKHLDRINNIRSDRAYSQIDCAWRLYVTTHPDSIDLKRQQDALACRCICLALEQGIKDTFPREGVATDGGQPIMWLSRLSAMVIAGGDRAKPIAFDPRSMRGHASLCGRAWARKETLFKRERVSGIVLLTQAVRGV